MPLSTRATTALRTGLADNAAGDEIAAAINESVGGSAQALDTTDSPTFAALTLTGNATVGGDVKVASGHTVKVNNISVVGAQQAAIVKNTVSATSGSLPTAGGTTVIADATAPTVVELLDLAAETLAKLNLVIDVLHAHGLTA